MAESNDLSARTDDVARRIEYVTGGKWSDDQYKKVCAMLRYYRHKSMSEFMDRLTGKENPDAKEGGSA